MGRWPQLRSRSGLAPRLAGVTWGAEDLPAAIGAATAREADGSYTDPYRVVRALTLFGAHAAGVPAIEVRAISNEISESDRARWRIGRALEALADALPRMLEAAAQ